MRNSFRPTFAPEPACTAGKPRLLDRVSESPPESAIMGIEMILPHTEFLRGLLTWGQGVKCILGWMSFYFNTEEFIAILSTHIVSIKLNRVLPTFLKKCIWESFSLGWFFQISTSLVSLRPPGKHDDSTTSLCCFFRNVSSKKEGPPILTQDVTASLGSWVFIFFCHHS